jgi:chorismate synthase
MPSTIGNLFRLTTFGESHGESIGGIIDGCPSGFSIDLKNLQECLDKRKPGVSSIVSQRKESDEVEILSGVFQGKTLGTPIGFLIKNTNQKSKDYDSLKSIYRPSHADFTYDKKYGIRDYRGGGRSSARETANWVVAGSIAAQILKTKGVSVYSYVSSVGGVDVSQDYLNLDLDSIYNSEVRCPCVRSAKLMRDVIEKCKKNGDTVGGCVSTVVKGVPFGLGEPVFNKFQAGIAHAVMSVNACKGVSFGSGFSSSKKTGSKENDEFILKSGGLSTKTNNSGGIQGGITNGEDVCFHAAFKPVSTIMQSQNTINKDYKEVVFTASGRHDPCVVPRAVSVVESLTAIVILDYYLLNKTTKISDL